LSAISGNTASYLYLGSFPLRSTVTFTAFPAMSLIPFAPLLSVIGYLAELRAVRTTACRLLNLRRGRRAKAVLSPQASAY